MKIAFVIESAYNTGGMEKMLSTIANALCGRYDVSVVTAFNEGRSDAFLFDKCVRRADLGLRLGDYHSGKAVKKAYMERLEAWLMADRQDVVVSLASMEFFFLYKIKDGSKKMVWFHFALSRFMVGAPFKTCPPLHWLWGWLYQLRYFHHARHYDKVVVLSKADLEGWRRFVKRATFIYNPITVTPVSIPDYSVHRAMAAGRLDYLKGFDYLVDAWAIVHSKHPDWALDIYGEGSLRGDLQRQIDKLGLAEAVFLRGNTADMPSAYAQHSVFVLSSRSEGFGLWAAVGIVRL